MIDLTKARCAYTKHAIYIVHPEIVPHVIELTNYGTFKIKVLSSLNPEAQTVLESMRVINAIPRKDNNVASFAIPSITEEVK